MSHVTVLSRTQRIVVDPHTSSVSVVNAGPAGPAIGTFDGVTSPTIDDIVTITQAAYDALGPGRPSTRLYVITG